MKPNALQSEVIALLRSVLDACGHSAAVAVADSAASGDCDAWRDAIDDGVLTPRSDPRSLPVRAARCAVALVYSDDVAISGVAEERGSVADLAALRVMAAT